MTDPGAPERPVSAKPDPTPAAGAPEPRGLREALIVAWSNGLNAIEHWRLGEEFADAVLNDPTVRAALATAPEPSLLAAVKALRSAGLSIVWWRDGNRMEDMPEAINVTDDEVLALAAVKALQSPKRYENDRNGNWWTTDMEYGWEEGVAAVLALIESRATSREAGPVHPAGRDK